MKYIKSVLIILFSSLTVRLLGTELDVLPAVRPLAIEITKEFKDIPPERQRLLRKVALFIGAKSKAGEEAKLIFICTHNSRRSHLCQIWAQTAAAFYGVAGVRTYSGGTEATACNERTIGALKRAGFEVSNSTPEQKNPVYLVKYGSTAEPIRAYSKVYSSGANPKSDFAAIMTCDSADKNCPIVEGSVIRVPIPFVDPKVSDGTDKETATYDERCRQIAREMFFLMKQVN